MLEEVSEFTYLGFNLARNGNLLHTQEVRISNAHKAQGTLDTYLRKHKHLPVKIICELFDSLVKSCLLYGCEVWGCDISNEIEISLKVY